MEFIQKNWHLFLLAFVSGAMLLWPVLRRAGAGGATLGTMQATQLINREDAVVLDVRDAADYARGHVLGAKNLPVAEFERRAAELAKWKDRPVIVTCGDGNKSLSALGALRKAGLEKVYALGGGYPAWQAAGLPTEKGA